MPPLWPVPPSPPLPVFDVPLPPFILLFAPWPLEPTIVVVEIEFAVLSLKIKFDRVLLFPPPSPPVLFVPLFPTFAILFVKHNLLITSVFVVDIIISPFVAFPPLSVVLNPGEPPPEPPSFPYAGVWMSVL